MDKIIEELLKIYPNTKFKFHHVDGKQILLYNDINLEFDDKFIDKSIQLALLHLKGDALDDFTFVFDYLNRIDFVGEYEINPEIFEPKMMELMRYSIEDED